MNETRVLSVKQVAADIKDPFSIVTDDEFIY
jgi:hypothetical protein